MSVKLTAANAASAGFNTIGSIFTSTNTAIGMVTTSIEGAARRQQARHKLDAVSYKKTIATEKAMELELQKEQVIDWCDQVEGRSDRFNETYEELLAALN